MSELDEFLAEKKRIAKELTKKKGESFDEREPICPHCAEELLDVWDYDLELHVENKVECYHCNEKYWVTPQVRYSTRKPKPDDHDLE